MILNFEDSTLTIMEHVIHWEENNNVQERSGENLSTMVHQRLRDSETSEDIDPDGYIYLKSYWTTSQPNNIFDDVEV